MRGKGVVVVETGSNEEVEASVRPLASEGQQSHKTRNVARIRCRIHALHMAWSCIRGISVIIDDQVQKPGTDDRRLCIEK
jgi:hypothetical protein